jgi:glycosyltransferase involved in cell wall biosynthesis
VPKISTLIAANPSIAVIVPNWNDAIFLPACIKSLLDQEFPPDEIVIVDDKSTDNSVAVIHRLISAAPHATLIENEKNLGTNGALNVGLSLIQSDYVLFLASNDYVLPGIFARAKACLSSHPGAALWSAMVWLVDESGQTIRLHPSPVLSMDDAWFSPAQCQKLAVQHGNWFTGPTMIYHRVTLTEAGGFDPTYKGLSDLLTALMVASRNGATYSPEPFGVIRVHRGSFLSRTFGDSKWIEDTIATLAQQGPLVEVKLFTSEFLRRFAGRIRFAMVRTAGQPGIQSLAHVVGGWKGHVLQLICQVLSPNMAAIRLIICFCILRPFDIPPTIWNRFIGSIFVRVRLVLRKLSGSKV